MTRLVQLQNGSSRHVAVVDEPHLRLLAGVDSIYALAMDAAATNTPLRTLVHRHVSSEQLEYDAVYSGQSAWRLLVPIDHPHDAARCLVSGTGLTHLGSAADRQAMHRRQDDELTDSMKMFRAGLDGGRPAAGCIGTAPEWFYKGTGTVLRAHGEPLVVPSYADDGGEEAEIAGVYLIDSAGQPRRIGMATANEFSDHQFEKTNYLNLAASKLRSCALGPELTIDPEFESVPGTVTIVRVDDVVWSKAIVTGEAAMCHSLANIEHHHFKHEAHRQPGDLHVHYFGAHGLSFGDGVRLLDGDEVRIQFAGFGRALRNRVRVEAPNSKPIAVRAL